MLKIFIFLISELTSKLFLHNLNLLMSL